MGLLIALLKLHMNFYMWSSVYVFHNNTNTLRIWVFKICNALDKQRMVPVYGSVIPPSHLQVEKGGRRRRRDVGIFCGSGIQTPFRQSESSGIRSISSRQGDNTFIQRHIESNEINILRHMKPEYYFWRLSNAPQYGHHNRCQHFLLMT